MKKLTKFLIGLGVTIFIIVGVLVGGYLLVKKQVIVVNKYLVMDSDTKGIKISDAQGKVDFDKLKDDGIKFFYLKATEGSSVVDGSFNDNWTTANKDGVTVGAYHTFDFGSSGVIQAEHFINTVGKIKGNLIPMVEFRLGEKWEDNPPKTELIVGEIKNLLSALEKKYKVKPLLYSDIDFYEKYLKSSFASYGKWISAIYYPLSWKFKEDWTMWEYMENKNIEGCSPGESGVSMNIINKDKKMAELVVP